MGDAFPVTVVSVAAAAARLSIAPHRVRRLLQGGRLPGRKLGREWAVLWPTDARMRGGSSADHNRAHGSRETPHRLTSLRQQLRQLGTTLIRTGNAYAQARPARGAIFLTWRRPNSLAVTFAMGRVTPTQQWAPYALGIDLPFWRTDRARWAPVIPVVRRYDRVRGWCVPRLVRLAGVAAASVTKSRVSRRLCHGLVLSRSVRHNDPSMW
jgi:hypothetical protein